jgi:hypothetical protein
MEKLSILVSQSIHDAGIEKMFLKYCEVYCGWLPGSEVDEQSFKTCLRNFMSENPIFTHFIEVKD